MGSEIILDALMVLLGDEAQVEARFSLFGDSANLDVILEAPDSTPRRMYHRLECRFGCTRWNS
jgi:hypothetical protein